MNARYYRLYLPALLALLTCGCVMGEQQIDPAANPVVKLFRSWMPVTSDYHDGKFFLRGKAYDY